MKKALKSLEELPQIAKQTVTIYREGEEIEVSLYPVMAKETIESDDYYDYPSPPLVEKNGEEKLDYTDAKYLRALQQHRRNAGLAIVCHALGKDLLGDGTIDERINKMLSTFRDNELALMLNKVNAANGEPSPAMKKEAEDLLSPTVSIEGGEGGSEESTN